MEVSDSGTEHLIGSPVTHAIVRAAELCFGMEEGTFVVFGESKDGHRGDLIVRGEM